MPRTGISPSERSGNSPPSIPAAAGPMQTEDWSILLASSKRAALFTTAP
jgi:hypothetical protein